MMLVYAIALPPFHCLQSPATSSPSPAPRPFGQCGSSHQHSAGWPGRKYWRFLPTGLRCCKAPPVSGADPRGGYRAAAAAPRPGSGSAGIPHGRGRFFSTWDSRCRSSLVFRCRGITWARFLNGSAHPCCRQRLLLSFCDHLGFIFWGFGERPGSAFGYPKAMLAKPLPAETR